MNRPRMLSALALAALLSLLVPLRAVRAGTSAPGAGQGRVVILGFDGADANRVRDLMKKDPERYPTFRKLAESGVLPLVK